MDASTPIGKVANYLLLWKISLTRLAFRCSITALTFYLAGMPDAGWSDWPAAAKWKFLAGMAVSVLVLLSTFLDKAEKSFADGNLIPPDIGDTQTFTREQVKTETVQTASSSPAVSASERKTTP